MTAPSGSRIPSSTVRTSTPLALNHELRSDVLDSEHFAWRGRIVRGTDRLIVCHSLLQREQDGELAVDHRALCCDREVRRDQAGGSGELSLAVDYLPDHRAQLEAIHSARPEDALAYRPESERAGGAVADAAHLYEAALAGDLHFRLEGGRRAIRLFDGALDCVRGQGCAKSLAVCESPGPQLARCAVDRHGVSLELHREDEWDHGPLLLSPCAVPARGDVCARSCDDHGGYCGMRLGSRIRVGRDSTCVTPVLRS